MARIDRERRLGVSRKEKTRFQGLFLCFRRQVGEPVVWVEAGVIFVSKWYIRARGHTRARKLSGHRRMLRCKRDKKY